MTIYDDIMMIYDDIMTIYDDIMAILWRYYAMEMIINMVIQSGVV